MKKSFVLCCALLISLAVSACSTVPNPIGNNTLASAISTYGILDTAVIAYRGLPRCTVDNNFSATNVCYKRSVLVQAQAYDKAANAAINRAVSFQRSNPTLDATSYVAAAIASVNTFKDFAHASQLPGVQ